MMILKDLQRCFNQGRIARRLLTSRAAAIGTTTAETTLSVRCALCLAVFLSGCFGASWARAEVITAEFIGTVTSLFDIGNSLNGTIIIGDPVQGRLTYDPNSADFASCIGNLGNFEWESLTPPNEFEVTINGLTWAADSSGNPAMSGNVQNDVNGVVDTFTFAGRNEEGSTFPVAQFMDTLTLSFSLIDDSATMHADACLPTSIDLGSLPLASGTGGVNASTSDLSSEYGIFFSLDTFMLGSGLTDSVSVHHIADGVSQFNYVNVELGPNVTFKLMNPSKFEQFAAILLYEADRGPNPGTSEVYGGCLVEKLTPHASVGISVGDVRDALGLAQDGSEDIALYAELIWAPTKKVTVGGSKVRLADGLGGNVDTVGSSGEHHAYLGHPGLFSLPFNSVVSGQKAVAKSCICSELGGLGGAPNTFGPFGIRC